MVLDIIKNVAVVGAGSFIGGAARYLVSLLMKGIGKGFPWATLSVNLVGCFQIVGNNTNYLLAAEECMAENFGLVFGNGLNGYYDFGD